MMKLVNKGIKKQHGFTLVELMIAMVVGLLIILGAGQLFITGLQNFHQIERIGNRQGTILFATDMLVSDIRRARVVETNWDDDELELFILYEARTENDGCEPGEEVRRTYFLGAEVEGEGHSLKVLQQCGTDSPVNEPLATGFASGGFQVDDSEGSDGVWRLEFCLLLPDGSEPSCEAGESGGDLISIYAVNRSQAIR